MCYENYYTYVNCPNHWISGAIPHGYDGSLIVKGCPRWVTHVQSILAVNAMWDYVDIGLFVRCNDVTTVQDNDYSEFCSCGGKGLDPERGVCSEELP